MLIIKIHNDGTGTKKIGNYTYGIYINERRIANGRLDEHYRSLGWEGLVAQLAKQVFYDGYKPTNE